ncbi:MAG: radical SAM/Cys-rich domain protein [Acidobacteria bacterium]|nr:MAG: radical SAM/Cys-rich domain protein [Acidobacteriota bacterium]REK07792.1 MAG: radical SAM/Cys-rich domain protein [Acidobacteriota bacterium]
MTALPLPVLPERAFHRTVEQHTGDVLRAAAELTTLQINIGLVCNLACRHCHVESGPKRLGGHENMSRETVQRILSWLDENPGVRTVDITGGSAEMNPHFRDLVRGARQRGLHVMDRCNPTIIVHRDRRTGATYDWIPAFLAEHRVEVVASMPCYLEDNVNHQRGRGAYDASVEGLRRLNEVGYGSDPELPLNLVYNPNGPHLPPPEASLQEDYRRELKERFGLVFDQLWTITNMPIKRWRADLERAGQLEQYLDLLVTAFNPSTVEGLMCRHQIHVDSQGRLSDCDFNRALDLDMADPEHLRLWDVSAEDLAGRRIVTGDHCYGCTAGAGSSCGGSLA